MESRSVPWDVWSNIPDAKVWSAVALSLDINPSKVRRRTPKRVGYKDPSAAWSPFAEDEEFEKRLLVAEANVGDTKALKTIRGWGDPKRERVISLPTFAAWAVSIGWENLPPQFSAMASGPRVASVNEEKKPPRNGGTLNDPGNGAGSNKEGHRQKTY